MTAENINEFTLAEVVLPMIGYETRLPKNEDLQQIFKETMMQEGITLDHFHQIQKVEATSAQGSYRKIIAQPDQMEFDIVQMQNENEDLLTPQYLEKDDPVPKIDTEIATPVTKAIRMRFNLTPSSYATMLIREVTRVSSAFYAQRAISNTHRWEQQLINLDSLIHLKISYIICKQVV